ncbi:protein mesh-like isoform X3 [Dysidea avara]|uniref:protein mesh-like isoform X3 n=1 Tax=Dysidea avara TaxID=196820 RepID=UPI00332EC385
MMLLFVVLGVSLLLLEDVSSIPLEQFYPFGSHVNDAFLLPNDDGSSQPITLSSDFPFFNQNFRNIYVSTNGAISFTRSISTYTPDQFPLNDSKEIIAPFWADVDTTGTGGISYRETTDPDLLSRADEDIKVAFPRSAGFSSSYLFIATWNRVGYYESKVDKTNTFQAVLATNGLQSFVIFLYADGEIQWTTGDASSGLNGLGGIPAQVGFNAGDGLRYAAIPQSRTNAIINITRTSNIGVPGVWVFRIDEEDVVIAGCQRLAEEENGTVPISLYPRYGSVLGGTPVQVFGPCFDGYADAPITCYFDNIEVEGIFVNENYILCISPPLQDLGSVAFTIRLNGVSVEFKEVVFYSLAIDDADMVSTATDTDQFYVSGDTVSLVWDRYVILPRSLVQDAVVSVNIDLVELDNETGDTNVIARLANGLPNTANFDVTIPQYDGVSLAVIQISVVDLVPLHTTISNHQQQAYNRLVGEVKLWSEVLYISGSNSLLKYCANWYRDQPDEIGQEIVQRLPSCPLSIEQAKVDNKFEEEDLSASFSNTFHPGVSSCFRQIVFTSDNEGSGQQCCYDDGGELVVGPPGGGTVDLYAPTSWTSTLSHFTHDVLPFIYCCKGAFSNCDLYYQKRPSDNGKRYILKPPAFVYGDPHMITLDGFKYTFNGKGEFTLIEHKYGLFTLQARMEAAEDNAGSMTRATVITAIAAKQNDSDTVQFELSRRGLDALVNGERVIFDDMQKQEFTNVTISDMGNQMLSALFSSGAYVQAKAENGIISVLLVSLSDTYKNSTSGLMGVFNGDMADDLMRRNSSEYLPLSSTNELIHEFGLDWILNEEQSLFTYLHEDSWQTYYDPNFTPVFSPVFSDPELEEAAIFVCNGDTFCLYDIATTGRMDIGLSTLDGSMRFEEILRLSYPGWTS